MQKIILELDYGKREIKNLRKVWIQPAKRRFGFMLCYEDELYERGILYHSINKPTLIALKKQLIEAYNSGKSTVKL